MLKIGYYNGKRLHISEYNPDVHEGQVRCDENHLMIAKRGTVRMHHFCHRPGEGENCSSSDGMTAWHLWWQTRIISKNIELRITKTVSDRDGTREVLKIADSFNSIGPNKDILSITEFQHSIMSASEIAFREAFYSRTDLMSQWGLPQCKSELTWIFDISSCDIEIEYTFGDMICFKWLKGTKYMFPAQARTFYDLGRRDLIQIFAIHKPKTLETKLIGRLISLETLDKFLFDGILDLKGDDDRRLNTHPLADYEPLLIPIDQTDRLDSLIELLKINYFKKAGRLSKSREKEIQNCLIGLV